jgi:hypothetical protein
LPKGNFRKARSLLGKSERYAQEMETPSELSHLELMRSLAIAERCDRGLSPDRPHRRITYALSGLRALLGKDHPSALAAELTLGVEQAALGNHRAAIKHAERCRDQFTAIYDAGHPIVRLCQVDLGAFQLLDDRPEAALRTLQDAGDGLAATLGDQHPWTVAARLHRARALAGVGRSDDAREQASQVMDVLELLEGADRYRTAAEAVQNGHAIGAGDPRMAVYLDVPFI